MILLVSTGFAWRCSQTCWSVCWRWRSNRPTRATCRPCWRWVSATRCSRCVSWEWSAWSPLTGMSCCSTASLRLVTSHLIDLISVLIYIAAQCAEYCWNKFVLDRRPKLAMLSSGSCRSLLSAFQTVGPIAANARLLYVSSCILGDLGDWDTQLG